MPTRTAIDRDPALTPVRLDLALAGERGDSIGGGE
jgi:hypothetical protein